MAHVHELRRMAKSVRVGAENKSGRALLGGKEFQEFLAEEYANELRYNIERALDVAGQSYALGRQVGSDAGHGKIRKRIYPDRVQITWVGRQIEYIEYGAGAPAVEHPYQGKMPSWYSPQAEGHAGGRYWFFRNTKIEGWKPYAPFYKTYLKWTNGLYNKKLKKKFQELMWQRKAALMPISKFKKININVG